LTAAIVLHINVDW